MTTLKSNPGIWYFRPHFSCGPIPCLAIQFEKNETDNANIIKKPHNFVRKTKNYLKKPT